MSQQSCSVCGASTSGLILCRKHVDLTRQDLRSLPAHALDLHVMLQRMTRTGTPNDGGKAADPALTWQRLGPQFLEDVAKYLKDHPVALPYAKPAADLLHETRRLLVKWTRHMHGIVAYPHRLSIPLLSAFLLANLKTLLLREDIGELTTALEDLCKRITKAIDLPEDRTRFQVGPCPEVADGDRWCPGVVWAYFPQSSGWGQETPPPSMRCKVCGAVWFGQHFNRAGIRILARKANMDAAHAAALETAS